MIANIDLTDLTAPAPTHEIVIPLRPIAAGWKRLGHTTAMQRLVAALKRMRAAGYEVDIYLRGTWTRGAGPRILNDYRLELWKLTDNVLVASGERTQWRPMVTRTPGPEIVLRGVK